MKALDHSVRAGVVVLALAGISNAALLNWNAPGIDYPAGAVGPLSFNNVDGSGVNVTFQWVGNTNRFLNNYNTGSGTVTLPDDDATQTTWGMSGLWYGTQFASTSESVSLIVSFSQPVYNVSFHVFDIDGVIPHFEKLRVKGFLGGTGGTPTLPSTYDGGDDVDIEIIPVDMNPATEDGIVFWNGTAAESDPPDARHEGWMTFAGPIDTLGIQFKGNANQAIGQILGNISFVPEPATLAVMALGTLLMARRRR